MVRKLAWFGVFFAAFTASIALAHADPARRAVLAEPAPSTDAVVARNRWYGWQTLALDAGVIGLAFAGARVADDGHRFGFALAGSGVALYALSAPSIHWAHHRPVAAGTSLALRVVLPLVSVGLLVGADAGRCAASGEPEHGRFCHRMDQAMVIAATLSAVAASGFDAAVLGWERAPKPAPAALAPLLAWDGRSGGLAGLRGSF